VEAFLHYSVPLGGGKSGNNVILHSNYIQIFLSERFIIVPLSMNNDTKEIAFSSKIKAFTTTYSFAFNLSVFKRSHNIFWRFSYINNKYVLNRLNVIYILTKCCARYSVRAI